MNENPTKPRFQGFEDITPEQTRELNRRERSALARMAIRAQRRAARKVKRRAKQDQP